MRSVLALGVTAGELMGALGSDDTTFLGAEQGGDLFPGLALLTLLADEIHERFEPTVKGSTAAESLSFHWLRVIHSFRIHQQRAYNAACLPC